MLDVFLVEDSPADAELIRAMLEKRCVSNTSNVAFARERLADPARRPASLVLLDLSLPGFVRRGYLRSDRRGIALSDRRDHGRRRRRAGPHVAREGSRGYVVKGEVDAQALRKLIHEVVRDC